MKIDCNGDLIKRTKKNLRQNCRKKIMLVLALNRELRKAKKEPNSNKIKQVCMYYNVLAGVNLVTDILLMSEKKYWALEFCNKISKINRHSEFIEIIDECISIISIGDCENKEWAFKKLNDFRTEFNSLRIINQ